MLMTFSYFIPIITFMAILTLVLQRHHLLMALLALEGVILSFTFVIMMKLSLNEIFISLIMLTFGACEASLGLACLVLMIRSMGNDHFKSLSLIKC